MYKKIIKVVRNKKSKVTRGITNYYYINNNYTDDNTQKQKYTYFQCDPKNILLF